MKQKIKNEALEYMHEDIKLKKQNEILKEKLRKEALEVLPENLIKIEDMKIDKDENIEKVEKPEIEKIREIISNTLENNEFDDLELTFNVDVVLYNICFHTLAKNNTNYNSESFVIIFNKDNRNLVVNFKNKTYVKNWLRRLLKF